MESEGGCQNVEIVRRLSGVEKLLRELSPVYRADEEVGMESVFWTAVLGSKIRMEERVQMMMGE